MSNVPLALFVFFKELCVDARTTATFFLFISFLKKIYLLASY